MLQMISAFLLVTFLLIYGVVGLIDSNKIDQYSSANALVTNVAHGSDPLLGNPRNYLVVEYIFVAGDKEYEGHHYKEIGTESGRGAITEYLNTIVLGDGSMPIRYDKDAPTNSIVYVPNVWHYFVSMLGGMFTIIFVILGFSSSTIQNMHKIIKYIMAGVCGIYPVCVLFGSPLLIGYYPFTNNAPISQVHFLVIGAGVFIGSAFVFNCVRVSMEVEEESE